MAYEEDMMNSLIASLPLQQEEDLLLRNYKGFWIPETFLPGIVWAHTNYKPRDSDVILVSSYKCGTTWLKALAFATANRVPHPPKSPNHPLLLSSPHRHVPTFERGRDLDSLPSPRIISTHMARSLLPLPPDSDLRVVYICRDPRAQFVSGWHFRNEATPDPVPLEVSFRKFCDGIFPYGPAWDHVLGYWEESRKSSSRILFLTYEEMMEDTVGNLRRMAEFMRCPFSEAEEREGVAEEIAKLCSFENLKGVEANGTKGNSVTDVVKVSTYFRKGKVGDWKNYLTVAMAEKMDEITKEKWGGTGLMGM